MQLQSIGALLGNGFDVKMGKHGIPQRYVIGECRTALDRASSRKL
jgi:hypothetical protein